MGKLLALLLGLILAGAVLAKEGADGLLGMAIQHPDYPDGLGVVIKPRVNIHFPWKLTLGDHCWLGEECWLLNFEPFEIGDHVCISQRAFLCGGNHDFRQPDFPYRNGSIRVARGAWVGAQVFVAPGITIGEYAVATAGSVVVKDLPPSQICAGNPCQPVKNRFPAA